LKKAGFSNYIIEQAKDMPTIVANARKLAMHGDTVLLSPGFSSFDMFKNFVDRGEKYVQAVQNL